MLKAATLVSCWHWKFGGVKMLYGFWHVKSRNWMMTDTALAYGMRWERRRRKRIVARTVALTEVPLSTTWCTAPRT